MGKFKQAGVISSAVLLSGLLAGCALQGARATPEIRDADITANFETQLGQHPDLGPPNEIHAATHHHVVYLSGLVATPLQSERAAALARQTDGVSAVVNSVAVEQ